MASKNKKNLKDETKERFDKCKLAVGQAMKEAREGNPTTAERMGQLLGVSKNHIWDMEAGRANIPIQYVLEYGKITHTDPGIFFEKGRDEIFAGFHYHHKYFEMAEKLDRIPDKEAREAIFNLIDALTEQQPLKK